MRFRALCLAAILLLASCHQAPIPPRVEKRAAGRMGTVRLYIPARAADDLVFLFSDVSGWSTPLTDAATALTARGAVVVGVDLGEYLRGLAASDDGCHYLLSEVEFLSQTLQRELRFNRYASPILAGVGAGGTLAYAALAQSPAATVAGAVSLDPAPALRTRVPLCPGAPSSPVPGGGFRYGPRSGLPGWWRLGAPTPMPEYLKGLLSGTRATVVVTSEKEPLAARLEALIAPALLAAPTPSTAVEDLPLVEYPVSNTGRIMAVIFSGDGGWRDIDKQVGEILQKRGVPVVGVDCLRYFWREKSPEEVAVDLAEIIRVYERRWNRDAIILAGYSFGADILPFAYNRLPPEVRRDVVQLSLLGLESTATFEIKIADILGKAPPDEGPLVLPEIRQIEAGKIQCFYGEDEDDTLCRDAALAAAEIIHTSGGHHFDGDYAALADDIVGGARRRVSENGPGGAANKEPHREAHQPAGDEADQGHVASRLTPESRVSK